MMREIKFRCWDMIDKKWMFGYDYKNLGGFSLIGEIVLFGQLNTISLERWNDVAIMQFTGLKDKNGIEIYEGDILSNGVEWCNAEIKFDKGCFMWNNEPIGFNGDDDGYTYSPPSTWGEVIGNIYEHPNLLVTI